MCRSVNIYSTSQRKSPKEVARVRVYIKESYKTKRHHGEFLSNTIATQRAVDA